MARANLEDIDENRSIWIMDKPAYEPCAPLAADTSADVVIVGGGFTGASTAYHLAKRFPERRIVLLEARQLANGASGRNGGLMLNWINGVHSPTPEHARRIFDVTRSGIDLIENIIREHALPVRYSRGGCLELYTKPERSDAAQLEIERFNAAGIPLQFLQGKALEARLGATGVAGAVFDPTAGRLDGVDYLRALRGVLLSLGVAIHENTLVRSIEEGASVRVMTDGGEVTAKALVLATNAYTRNLGYFRSFLFPVHSHVVATRPLSPEERAAVGWGNAAGFSDDLDRVAYGSLTENGEIVFGGGSNGAYSYRYGGRTSYQAKDDKGFQAIERRLGDYFPGARGMPIAHRWSGPVALTLSRVCAMGVRGEHRNVYYAFGYSGHGISLANLAGKVLCDIYSDDDVRWRDLPFYQPRLHPMPPEPFRTIGYHFYTRVTGRSPRKQH
ncbi:MAG: FAD-binding oxidoreductase [Myxococcales bacterium]|nr:FAD-binding oxidoreductase [Myxococcales bacterium]